MDNIVTITALIGVVICIILLITLIIKSGKTSGNGTDKTELDSLKREISESSGSLRLEVSSTVQSSVKHLGDMVSENQKAASDTQNRRLDDINRSIAEKQDLMSRNIQTQMKQIEDSITSTQKTAYEGQNKRIDDMNAGVQTQLRQFEERLKTLETTNSQSLSEMRETVSKHLSYIQEDNNKKLDQIRSTVDDKLQKTLDEKMTNSFKLVSERLEQVYKGLGEMQSLASGVGDLKKVLSNVKTRGILGEIQLGAILSEILTPEQYDTEIATVPGSKEHVEFAVKLPARESGESIYLPIDSKFPGDTYAALQDAYQGIDPEVVKTARKNLETVMKKCAKDIHDKYICPPYTTNFAIMFLPFEGLYAEAVNLGLVEVLQKSYSVNIAGPSTMAAMLNALQMGFKTLQVQKRSSEVWKVLSEVKAEFDNFEKVFQSAQKRIRQLDEDMDKLVGVRTRAIQKKLRGVQLENTNDIPVIEIDETEE